MRTAFARAAVLFGVVGLVACGTPPPSPPSAAPGPQPTVPSTPTTPPPPSVAPAPAPAAPAQPDPLAARFIEPSVALPAPAFQPGRTTFTTQAELQAWMQTLARDAAPVARIVKAGTSQKGVSIDALLFTRETDPSPAAMQRSSRATVLLVGQQRGDEGASAEALMLVAQDLARGRLQQLLDRVNVLVLPRANPDGALTGERMTASGVELDRDHLVLQTPEAQAQARLVRDYQPVLVAYAREYDLNPLYQQKFGAVQAHDALVQYATAPNLPPFITKAAHEWVRQPLVAALGQQGLSVDWFHGTSADPTERKLTMGSTRADTARNVQGLKNAVSLMVATRGAGTGRQYLKRRVYTQVVAMTSVLASAAQRGADLLKLRQFVEAEVSSQACQGAVVVEAASTASEYTVTMLDAATGAPKAVTVNWDSALVLGDLKSRPRPCGYWLDADQTEAVSRLRLLGVRVEQVEAKGVVQGATYTQGTGAEVKDQAALLDLPVGSFYVPLSQPLAALVVAALEPDTAFSYKAAGLIPSLDKAARVMAWPGTKLSVMP